MALTFGATYPVLEDTSVGRSFLGRIGSTIGKILGEVIMGDAKQPVRKDFSEGVARNPPPPPAARLEPGTVVDPFQRPPSTSQQNQPPPTPTANGPKKS